MASSKGSSSKPIVLSPLPRHTDKGHDHSMSKGAAVTGTGMSKPKGMKGMDSSRHPRGSK